MDTDRLLKEATLCFVEDMNAAQPVSKIKKTGFKRIWNIYTGQATQKTAPGKKICKKVLSVAAIAAGVLILVFTIGTAASQDWDDSVFGALRRLLNQDLDQNEFSVAKEEIEAWHLEKTAFTFAGDEYSANPTVKELLIHGWKVKKAAGASGYYDTQKGPVVHIDSYTFVRGDELADIGLCGADISTGKSVRDCRIASIDINVDTYINQSNISDFSINGWNLLSCDIAEIDKKIAPHISSNNTSHHIGGTATEEQRLSTDTYIYRQDNIRSETGIYEIDIDVKTSDQHIFNICILFNAWLLSDQPSNNSY